MPFEHLPRTAATHFQLYSYAAVATLLEALTQSLNGLDAALREFPFLAGYHAELAAHGADVSPQGWAQALHAWEASLDQHLPLRALRDASGLDHAAAVLLAAISLPEEDARFGNLFDTLQGGTGQYRPTAGLLAALWPDARDQVRQWQALGVVQIDNPTAPRSEHALHLPPEIWDALRGDAVVESTATWAHYVPPDQLRPLNELLLPPALAAHLEALPAVLMGGDVSAVIVRGARHNGRHTLLGALARALGHGVLHVDEARSLDAAQPSTATHSIEAARWRQLGALAILRHALPVVAFDLVPGERAEVKALGGYTGPIGVVVSGAGGVTGTAVERAITLTLPVPDIEQRVRHWQRASPQAQAHAADIGERYRLTSGNIYRAAPLAHAHARLNGRDAIELADVRQACRALHRQALETLATPLEAHGDWQLLAVSAETQRDLFELEMRCRQRERLPRAAGTAFGSQVNAGVRALLTGPSGTGKTLAARVLGAQLQLDVYRLDLSAVVNKYIGETEKNLNAVFSRAEELDVILLIDEGDALLTQRTSVHNANDRYANLETNFLLQRLEAFSGIVIITTNSGERIDRAFQRRMDVIVDFRPPEAAERWLIWQLHLPAPHAVDARLLTEVVTRCALTGGQIRNAALHATLLAINNGGVVTNEYLDEAVRREYRQSGAVCPLRAMPQLSS